MRSARERENEAQLAVDYAIHTSIETGCPTFVHGDPFTHVALAEALVLANAEPGKRFSVGAIGGYRATTYRSDERGWIVTAIEAP